MHTRPQPLTYTFFCDSEQAIQILDIRLKELEQSLTAAVPESKSQAAGRCLVPMNE